MPIDFNDLLDSLRLDGKLFFSRLIKADPGKKIPTNVTETASHVVLDVEDEVGTASTVTIPKSTAGSIPNASDTEDGLMVSADFIKLGGVEDGAEANVGEEFSAAEEAKLTGIAAGATDDAVANMAVAAISGHVAASDPHAITFADLPGQIADAQIPASIMRDAELTAAAIRGLLGLTAAEVNDIFVGATISGQILTYRQNDGSTVMITVPTAMAGTGDGVVQSGMISGDDLVLTLDNSGTVTIDIDALATDTELAAYATIAALNAHEASTHNQDSTARSEALAAQTLIAGHQVASSPHTSAIQTLINATSLSSLQGQVTDGQIPAAIMRDAEFTAAAVRGLLALTSTEVNDLLTGATIAGQILTFTQNDGSTVNITIPTATPGAGDGVVQSGAFNADQTELVLTLDNGGTVTVDVPAALRGTGLTAAAIAALSPGATNSNTEIPSAHEGTLGKISIANIHAYMESSVGLGPRINPGPSLARAGQIPAVNAAGDAYELTTADGGTVTVIAGPVDAAASLSGQLQYNPGSKDVEICLNDGHVTVAPAGTWDYIPFNADFSIVQTRGSVLVPVVGQYIYDEGNDEFYNWVVVGADAFGNFVLGWRRVNPSTALAFARRTGTGIVVYWLGDQPSDAAALEYLLTQFPSSFAHADTDVFYLRNDTIRRLETYTAAGLYVDHWLWEPVIRYTVPTPTPHTAGEAVVVNALGTGHTTAYLPSRNDLVTHVAQIPDATAMSPELIKLEHSYAFGVRQDIVLRVATDGNIEGYLDLRLGEAVGSFSLPTPVVRIRAILNGINVHTWYTIFFFEEELAAEFDRVWLANEELTLGPVFAESGLWARRFTSQPTTTLQIDTDIAFNMRRAEGDTFFHTNDAGIRYQSGLYEKYQIRDDGDYAYEILSGPRIQHSDSVGEPLDEPTRNGQFNVDNLGRVWVGLVDRHLLTTDAAATSVPLLFDQYVRDPDTEADIHALGGLGGFTWIVGVGNRELWQVLSNTPSDIDRHRMWIETWDLAATRWAGGSDEYNLAISYRDAVWLGGFPNHTAAAEEASHIVTQAEFDGGAIIFYGHTTISPIQGIRRLNAYTQGTVTERIDGHWIGPFALVSDIETVTNDVLDDFVQVVDDEAAAIAAGDTGGILYLFP